MSYASEITVTRNEAPAGYWAFKVVVVVFFGIMFVTVCAEGLKRTFPLSLGQRLHRLPGFASLEQFENFQRIEVAQLSAVMILVCVSTLWERFIEAIVCNDLAQIQMNPKLHATRNRTLLFLIAPVFISSEALLFFRGLQNTTGWSGAHGPFDAFVGTLVYLSMMVACSYFAVLIKHR